MSEIVFVDKKIDDELYEYYENEITKIGVSALAGSLVAFSANAADVVRASAVAPTAKCFSLNISVPPYYFCPQSLFDLLPKAKAPTWQCSVVYQRDDLVLLVRNR